MTPIQQSKAAATFVAHWTGKGYEKGESQIFWTTLLNQIFGIEHPEQFIVFEQQVQLDHTSFVDARIPSTKVMIEQTAQAILDARAKYPDCSLADLYDEVTMPPELRKAHQDNDRAVMLAYGFVPGKTSESGCVAKLFERYQALTK